MDNFYEQHQEKLLKQASIQAYETLERGNVDAAVGLAHQIIAKDYAAIAPQVILMKSAMLAGNWVDAIIAGEQALRTRLKFENDGFDIGIPVTYDDIFSCLAESLAQLEASQAVELPSIFSLVRGLVAHHAKDYETARGEYLHVLNAGESVHYHLGQTVNLMHALEHQYGQPDDPNYWIDLETFPIMQKASDLEHLNFDDAFNKELLDEVMSSPHLLAAEEAQSKNWYVAQNLNEQDNNTRVLQLKETLISFIDSHKHKFLQNHPKFVHENFAQFPQNFTADMFAAVVRGVGYVGPHVHSNAFLIANYYAALPEGYESFAHPPVVFGKHLYSAALGLDYPTRLVVPEVGAMLMWPAYMSHASAMNISTDFRIVLGLDLNPKKSTPA